MAKLITCKDCQAEISPKAKTCPHCGAPRKAATSGCAWLALIGIVAVVVAGIWGANTPKPQAPSPPVPTATPRPITAAALRTVAVLPATDGQSVWQHYTAVAQIAEQNDGWYTVPCDAAVCPGREGELVAFRVTTGVGRVVPIWFVDRVATVLWVNGRAQSMTPDLSQYTGIDIGAALELIMRQTQQGVLQIDQ